MSATEIQNATINSSYTGDGRIPVIDDNYELVGWITVENGKPTKIEGEGTNTVKSDAAVGDEKDNTVYQNGGDGGLEEAEKTDLTSLTVTLTAPTEGKAVEATVEAVAPVVESDDDVTGVEIATVKTTWKDSKGASVATGGDLTAGEYTVTVTVALDPLYQVGNETTVAWTTEGYTASDEYQDTDLIREYTIEIEEEPTVATLTLPEGWDADWEGKEDASGEDELDTQQEEEEGAEGESVILTVPVGVEVTVTPAEDVLEDTATGYLYNPVADAMVANAKTATLVFNMPSTAVEITDDLYVKLTLGDVTNSATTGLPSEESNDYQNVTFTATYKEGDAVEIGEELEAELYVTGEATITITIGTSGASKGSEAVAAGNGVSVTVASDDNNDVTASDPDPIAAATPFHDDAPVDVEVTLTFEANEGNGGVTITITLGDTSPA